MSSTIERIAGPIPRGLAIAVDVASSDLVRPSGFRALRFDRFAAKALATVGRVAVVWLPTFAFSTGHYDSTLEACFISSVVTVAWALGLRAAFSASRSTLLAVGVWVAAAVGAVTGLVVVSALNAWLPWTVFTPAELIQMTAAIFLLSAIWESVIMASVAAEQKVLVVGTDPTGADIVEQLAELRDSPFQMVGTVMDDELADLPEIVRLHQPDIVVLTNHRPETFEALFDVAGAGFKVVGPPAFYEHAFGRVPVSLVNQSWFMSVLHLYRQPYTRVAKRVFDLMVASVGLLLTAPLLPLLVLAVSRTPGPIIFRQVRLGEGGAPFTILKFRTMLQDAETGGAMWAAVGDTRVTRVGAFMRRTRLDELPQLWNVLRGEMSVVGPRPERPEFVAELKEAVPFWSRRHLVKPGITGWAQLHRGYTADTDGTAEKLAYDLWYLRHRSLVLDLAICVKTFNTLVTGTGAR